MQHHAANLDQSVSSASSLSGRVALLLGLIKSGDFAWWIISVQETGRIRHLVVVSSRHGGFRSLYFRVTLIFPASEAFIIEKWPNTLPSRGRTMKGIPEPVHHITNTNLWSSLVLRRELQQALDELLEGHVVGLLHQILDMFTANWDSWWKAFLN